MSIRTRSRDRVASYTCWKRVVFVFEMETKEVRVLANMSILPRLFMKRVRKGEEEHGGMLLSSVTALVLICVRMLDPILQNGRI